MSFTIADGVLAATHKLVHQAMTGQWQEVPKTVEERRVLLDRLSSSATAQDQQWLSALQSAMAESDAAVAKMAREEVTSDLGLVTSKKPAEPRDDVNGVLNMIRGSGSD